MSTALEQRTIELTLISHSNLKETVEVPDGLEILEGTQEPIDKTRYVFRILDQKHGDKRVTWDSQSLREIQAAKKMFIDLIKKGFKPFKVGVNGQKTSEVMKEFDPRAEEVIFVPMPLVVGG